MSNLAVPFDSVMANLATAKQAIILASENKDLRKLIEIKAALQSAEIMAKNAEGLLLSSKEANQIAIIAQEFRLRAERAIGSIIPEQFQQGKRAAFKLVDGKVIIHKLSSYGLSHNDSSRAQKLARIPEPQFEEFLKKSNRKTEHALLFAAREIENEINRASPVPIHSPAKLSYKIILDDFRNSKLEDNSIDMIATDPPYGKEFLPFWEDLGKLAARVLKPGGYFVSYCGQSYLPKIMGDLSKSLTWHWMIALILGGTEKTPILGKDIFSMWKPILVFYKPPFKKRHFIDLQNPDRATGRDKIHHDWGQPVIQSVEQIEMFSDPGDTILDPCLGGGTTIEACFQSGRNCVGYENDKKTFEGLIARFPDAI